MKRLYVISGVSGMTGSQLAESLLLRDDSVVGFDNFFASSFDNLRTIINHPKFTFFEHDLCNPIQMKNLSDWIKSKECNDLIYINCAAVVHTEHFYEVESTYDTNVVGMKCFLQQAIDLKAQVYVNCSTSEVYSMQSWNDNGGVAENDYLVMATAEHSQRTSYATGKLLTEFFIKDAVDKGKILGCSIRFANVYSKDELYPKHIIPYIISSLKRSSRIVLLENSRINRRSFLNNIDSCNSIIHLMDTASALDGSVYNVATDEEISIVELVQLIAQKMGISDLDIQFEGYRSADPERRILNCDKIKTRTDWKPVVSLSQGLDLCIEQFKSK
jgi:nucleoside-diphosphate-sugar epimerase